MSNQGRLSEFDNLLVVKRVQLEKYELELSRLKHEINAISNAIDIIEYNTYKEQVSHYCPSPQTECRQSLANRATRNSNV